jgi:hypothetical protein
MKRRKPQILSMCDLHPMIQTLIREIKLAEIQNFNEGLHHLGGRSDQEAIDRRVKCYSLREEKLAELKWLMGLALPAGIKAGFTGEHVVASLHALIESVDEAAYWNAKSGKDDSIASQVMASLFDQARHCLDVLETWAHAASWFETGSAALLSTPQEKSSNTRERALVLLFRHPDWTDKKIASEVGCSGSYLSQQPMWRAARTSIQGMGQEGKHRAGRHLGHNMDQYQDGRPPTSQASGMSCASCTDPAGTDNRGRTLTRKGKSYCLECWSELQSRG